MPYVPGQDEPDEYVSWLAPLVWRSQHRQLDYIMIIVGFDDEKKILSVLHSREILSLQSTSVQEGPPFEQRNPVIQCEYPLDVDQDDIVQDARILKKLGGTDLSAIGVGMVAAFQLVAIFSQECCPYIAVA